MQNNRLRVRFWIEAGLAALTASLTILTLISGVSWVARVEWRRTQARPAT